MGCDDQVRADLPLAQTRRRGAGLALAQTLRGLQPTGRSARGLGEAHRHLPSRRALVFLVSDFHLPLEQIDAVLNSLALHEVVPVVLWDPLEFALTAPRVAWRRCRNPRAARAVAVVAAGIARALARGACSSDATRCWRVRRHRLKPLFIEGRLTPTR